MEPKCSIIVFDRVGGFEHVVSCTDRAGRHAEGGVEIGTEERGGADATTEDGEGHESRDETACLGTCCSAVALGCRGPLKAM
jgi:hypothetical protein